MLIVIEVLSLVFRTQNYYKKAFTYIYNSFSEIVYINKLDWDRQYLQFLAKKTHCEVLIKICNGIKDISYKQLSHELYKQLGKLVEQKEHYCEMTEDKFTELENKLKEKDQLIKKLGNQIYYYENHPSKEQYDYITELQTKLNSSEKELKQANLHIRELQNSEEYLNQYSSMLNERIEELRAKLYQFEIEQFSNLKEVEKNSDLKQFEQNVTLLKDLIHKGALRMATMKEEYDKLEAYNNQLIGEKSVLAKRAAIGFAELTPRPNYKQIFQDNNINVEQLLPQNVTPTTEELFSSLIKCFKEFYSRYVLSAPRLQIEQKSAHSTQPKDPAKMILNELQKARKQLRRTESLSIEVHKGYNKQKEQKNQMSKNKKK